MIVLVIGRLQTAILIHFFCVYVPSSAPLLSFLPTSAEELVWQYRRRHQYGSHGSTHTSAVDAVIMDAIIYAHTSLLGQSLICYQVSIVVFLVRSCRSTDSSSAYIAVISQLPWHCYQSTYYGTVLGEATMALLSIQ